MKKLLCKIFGHKWDAAAIPDDSLVVYFECKRCFKRDYYTKESALDAFKTPKAVKPKDAP